MSEVMWHIVRQMYHQGLPIDLCHAHEWVVTHTRMHHVTRMNGLCYTREYVISHIARQMVDG